MSKNVVTLKSGSEVTQGHRKCYQSIDRARLPLEFGIGVRGPKCLNDGATRWSKKFSDRFSCFDTIPAVTDTQPAS